MPLPPEILQAIMQQASGQGMQPTQVGYAVRQGGGNNLSVVNTATGQVHWSGTDPSTARMIAQSLNANPSLAGRR
jgi:hypothetical protein